MARNLTEIRRSAEGLLAVCEQTLENFGHAISDELGALVAIEMRQLRAALLNGEVARIEERIRALESVRSTIRTPGMYGEAEAILGERILSREVAADAVRLPGAAPQGLHAIFGYLIRSAHALLQLHREVWPLAAIIDSELGLAAFAVDDDSLDASIALEVLQQRLEAAWARGECSAAGTLVQIDPIDDSASEAVVVQLEHEGGAALAVLVPFDIIDGVVGWGQITVRAGSTIKLQ